MDITRKGFETFISELEVGTPGKEASVNMCVFVERGEDSHQKCE